MNVVYYIIQQTMFFAIPLLVVSLGAMYSQRSGVSNIAMEGIMIIGAFVGTVIINRLSGVCSGQALYLLAIAAAGLSGMLYSLFHAWSSIRLRADQTISGTALNMFAPAFCIFVARNTIGVKQISFHDSSFIRKVPVLGDIPFIGTAFFQNCYISTYLGILLLIGLSFLLNRTRFGLRLSACGENPNAAASAGVRVTKLRYIGVMLSGLLGGMGGVIFVVPTSTNFSASVAGYGFLALAVLILGQWKPIGILFAAFFFGLLKAVSSSYSGIPILHALPLPSEVYKIMPYLVTLLVLAFSSRKSRAPKAVGEPYDDGNGFGFSGSRLRKAMIAGACVLVVALVTISACTGSSRANRNGVSTGYGADIALVLTPEESVDDKSFVQGEWTGVVRYGADSGSTVKYYQAKDTSDESLKTAIEMAVKGRARTVVLADNNLQYAIYDVQDMYPDVSFVSVDCTPVSRSGDERIAENTVSFFIDEAASGFLAGYAAVKDGYRRLGFIGGMAIPPVIRYGYGYLTGAECAARELGLNPGDIRVMYHYAGTFSATPEVLSLASAWYQNGTEVIFACGGNLGNSVMKAAENTGSAVIGVDSDQSAESSSVITSAMKNLNGGLYTILDQIEKGEITGGKSIRLGAKENAVSLPMESSRFRNFDQTQYDEIYRRLSEGAFDLPDENAADSSERLPMDCVAVREVQ